MDIYIHVSNSEKRIAGREEKVVRSRLLSKAGRGGGYGLWFWVRGYGV